MLDELEQRINDLVIDIENLQKQYGKSLKDKDEQYKSLNKKTNDLNITVNKIIDGLNNKSDTANSYLNDIKRVSASTEAEARKNTDFVKKSTEDYNNLKKLSDKIQSDVKTIKQELLDAKKELTSINDSIDKIRKDQNALVAKQLSIENKGNDIIKNLKKAESDYQSKTDSIGLEFTKNLGAINNLSLEVDKVKNNEMTNYFISTDEVKRKWEQAIIEIINNNMEIVEMKEGMFKKKFILAKKQ